MEGREQIVEDLVTMKRSFSCRTSHWEAMKGFLKPWSDVCQFAFTFDHTGRTGEDVWRPRPELGRPAEGLSV